MYTIWKLTLSVFFTTLNYFIFKDYSYYEKNYFINILLPKIFCESKELWLLIFKDLNADN